MAKAVSPTDSKPQKVDISHINLCYSYSLALLAMLGPVYWGYTLGVVAPTQDYLKDWVYSDSSSGLLYLTVAIRNIGALLGALMASELGKRLGRRKAFMVTDILGIVAAAFVMLPHVSLLLIGRILIGAHSGFNCSIVPLYLGEWIPAEIKGKVGAFTTLGESIGVLIGYLLGLNMPLNPTDDTNQWWRVMFGIGAIFPFIRYMLLLLVFRYDTPVNLMKEEKLEEAEKAYAKVYKKEKASQIFRSQLRQLKSTQTVVAPTAGRRDKRAKTGMADMFKKKKYRKAVAFGSIFISGTQLTGYLYIINYATTIFKETSDAETSQIFTIILGCVSLFASLCSGPIIQRFGRKIIILIGFLMVAISHFIFMAISLNDSKSEALKYMVILVLFFYVITLGAVKWVYLGDILKGPGLGIANMINFTTAFTVTQVGPIISESVGPSETFAIFGVACGLCFFFALFFLKETKGLSYFETLNIFNKEFKLRKQTGRFTQAGGMSPKKKTQIAPQPLETPDQEKKESEQAEQEEQEEEIDNEDAISVDSEFIEMSEGSDESGDTKKDTHINTEAPINGEIQGNVEEDLEKANGIEKDSHRQTLKEEEARRGIDLISTPVATPQRRPQPGGIAGSNSKKKARAAKRNTTVMLG